MNLTALWRIGRGCSAKALRNLVFNFALGGARAMRLFERRMARDEPFFPAFLMLSVTNQCQLRCPGCWVEQTRPANSLTRRQLDGIVATARKYGSSFFGILGGEPLLHSEFMGFFKAHPRAYFQLFTNGLALDDATARRLAELGNVSPLISLEGLAEGTRARRGSEKIFDAALAAVQASVRAKLFTGVASSISRSNFGELVCEEHIERLLALGVHYVWYYIYRPVGGEPCAEETLTREQVTTLRKFIVEQRTRAKLLVIDAYWDADGRAVCPGAMGMSHHIAPDGAVEFCPPLQFASGRLNADASNLEEILQRHAYLRDLRTFTAGHSRGCILLDDPNALHDFLASRAFGAEDSIQSMQPIESIQSTLINSTESITSIVSTESCKSTPQVQSHYHELFDTTHRGGGLAELATMQSHPDHHDPENTIPDKSLLYRFAKRKYFFGFGAYG